MQDRFRLLLVEDSSGFRGAVRESLQASFPAIDIEEAIDGQEALLKFHAKVPDIVLMDISLPGVNGLELTKEIHSGSPEVPILILTTHDLPEYRKAARSNGAAAFISKASTHCMDDVFAAIKLFLAGQLVSPGATNGDVAQTDAPKATL